MVNTDCNEVLNAFILNRLPKEIFVGPYVLEMGITLFYSVKF